MQLLRDNIMRLSVGSIVVLWCCGSTELAD